MRSVLTLLAFAVCLPAAAGAQQDHDGDGYTVAQGDCDDHHAATWPGAPEACDGIDNDCDEVLPEDEWDSDGDVWMPCQGDCDDDDDTVPPTADELCDGVDNDCDGDLPVDEADLDGDHYLTCDLETPDCDDSQVSVHPTADEVCDGLDSDCDGDLPEGELDRDFDGVMPCDGDCDDNDFTAHAHMRELCEDGVDNDCDGEVDELCFDDSDDVPPTDEYGCAVRLGGGADAAWLLPLLPVFAFRHYRR